MVSKSSILRIARPTDNLQIITKIYIEGLGFELLAEFKDHNDFDGSIIGHKNHQYHLEFTHHRGTLVGKAPTQDHLLVFYISESIEFEDACKQMVKAGFLMEPSYNKFWDESGVTFEDVDGYRIVLHHSDWQL